MKTCCIISQPIGTLPFGLCEEDKRCIELKEAFLQSANRLIADRGITHFMCDLSLGFPLYAAELLLLLKARHPQITLECVLPYETQAEKWAEDFRDRYFAVCERADKETMLQKQYTQDCEQACTRYLIDQADIVFAIGEDSRQISYARSADKEIVAI